MEGALGRGKRWGRGRDGVVRGRGSHTNSNTNNINISRNNDNSNTDVIQSSKDIKG